MGRLKLKRERERKMAANGRTYLMSNLVYMSPAVGNLYLNLWLENQIKSLIDPTNLPALKERGYKLEYLIVTDDETLIHMTRHPNYILLSQHCEIHIMKMNWPPDTDRFQQRYGLLSQMFHMALPIALEKKAVLSTWVADLVFAKGALPKMMDFIEQGHDAVLNVPIRGAADAINPHLMNIPGAPSPQDLFNWTYGALHHLWTHSTWGNPYFTRMPYSMLWKSKTGLVAHNFGITPIIYVPNESMKNVQGVIDSDVPAHCKNPYWATDWTDAPVAGVEPLSNGHYPPFKQPPGPADIDEIVSWAKSATLPAQKTYLDKPLYYPNREHFGDADLAAQAKEIALTIQAKLGETPA